MTPSEQALRHRLVAILAADVAGYSRLMSLDDRATVRALDSARAVFRDRVAAHDGRVVDTAGDSVLAIFDTATGALRAALEVQERLAAADLTVTPAERMRFRIGVHLGDVIEKEDGTVYGDGVNIAARLEGLAEPGSIAVSQAIESAIHHRLQVRFVDIGLQQVKNIAQPIRAFRCDPIGASGPVATRSPPPGPAGDRRPASRPRWLVASLIGIVGIVFVATAWTAARRWLEPAAPVAYSAADRRMTFAVLPFVAPPGDEAGAKVASRVAEAVAATQERSTHWAQVASRQQVLEATHRHASPREVARALDVHFLLRGVVSADPPGYKVDLAVIDAATDRALGTQAIAIPPGATEPKRQGDLRSALGKLTHAALVAEVDRVRARPAEALDVRDLTFRAYVDWGRAGDAPEEAKSAHEAASKLLGRALAIAPDDPLALYVTAIVNLCGCVASWSKDIQEQEAVGSAAMEKFLRSYPENATMLLAKADLYRHHRRYEESLLVAESVLRRDPENRAALMFKTSALLRLGRVEEALATSNVQLQLVEDDAGVLALAAAVHYRARSYAEAAALAQRTLTLMERTARIDPIEGAVALTLVAAEARLGRSERAAAALREFNQHLPQATTIAAIDAWMHRDAVLSGDESLREGLRLAGVRE